MLIKIDVREKELIKIIPALLETYNLQHIHQIKIETLELGDIHICDIEENPDDTTASQSPSPSPSPSTSPPKQSTTHLILERKSLADLASSIRDGRYNEQSLRLHHCEIHNHNIWYIIEGSLKFYNPKYTKVDAKALYSSMVSLNYYKGFSVFRTFNIEETAEFILRTSDKIQREKKYYPFYKNNTQEEETHNTGNISSSQASSEVECREKSILKENTDAYIESIEPVVKIEQSNYKMDIPYSNTVKKVKKENITPENIGEIILSQIPGISNVLSLAILKEYGSLYNLMISISKDRRCLDNFKYKTANGQLRRLSASVIHSILTYLLYQKDTTITIQSDET